MTENPQPSDPDTDMVSLLTNHQSALRLYVNALLPGDPGAADVAQQANRTIWRKREDFTPGTHFKAWIFSIARFEVKNYQRRQSREQSRLVFSDALEELVAEELPHHSLDLEREQGALRLCLSKLKPNDRDLIQHRYFHRTPLKEYADLVGRSVGGLKVTLHRLRSILGDCISKQLAREGQG